jgi:hypothetical protein
MQNPKITLASIFTISILLSHNAIADGLSDLKSALERLNGSGPITAYYETQFLEVSDADDKDDRKENSGLVKVQLTDSEQGLQVTYSQEVMNKIEAESMQKNLDEETDTPTLNAVRDINATRMRDLLSAGQSLQRRIAKAEFVSEEQQNIEGRPARLLTFNLPLDAIIDDKKTREYVSKFEGKYSILIDSSGVPLESKTKFNGKGRAFVILSVKANSSNYNRYQIINNRLVRVQNEYQREFSSTFGDNSETGNSTLIVDQAQPEIELAFTPQFKRPLATFKSN